MSEFKLHNAPNDGISAVKFSPNGSEFLLASSWDNTVRMYDVDHNTMVYQYKHSMAVFDCAFHDVNHAYSGGLDKVLKCFDFTAQRETIVGTHDDAIRCVHYCPEVNVIITGSWDKTVKLWDPRMPTCAGNFKQPDKVFQAKICNFLW
jgi:cell cycle arrest protein BUB3